MSQETINYIVALVPSAFAVITSVYSCYKSLKKLTNTDSKLPAVNSALEKIDKSVEAIEAKYLETVNYCVELKNTLDETTKELETLREEQIINNELVSQLSKDVTTLTNQVDESVTAKIQEGYDDIKKINDAYSKAGH